MAAKAPIYLKRGSRRGKKERLRDVLSSDMISPPLGDFRHTIHIGSGAGPTTCLGICPSCRGSSTCSRAGRPTAWPSVPTTPHPHPQPTRPASVCGNPPGPAASHLLKNAISLPAIGGVQALTLPSPAPALPLAPPP
ncbi:hypothetical protein AAFF_G00272780, partial [Aldrovandia affinis]